MESDFNNSSNQDRRVDRVLLALCKEYVVVGKTRVKARHAWLVIGLVAGIAAGVILVANRSGEVEEGRAATASAISVELDLPSYYPDFLRHPQKFFSGQPLKITAPAFPDQAAVTLSDVATEKRQSVSVKQLKGEPSKAKIAGQTAFSFTPPVDLPSGRYRISFVAGGQTYGLELAINGLTAAEKNISGAITVPDLLQRIAIRYRTKICSGYCFWEMIFAGARDNSKILLHSSAGPSPFSRSTDGGRTWNASDINAITAYPRSEVSYGGDSKAVVENNGSFLLSSLMWTTLRGPSELGGVLYSGTATGGLTTAIFKDVSPSAPTSTWLFVDYPKLAFDPRIAAVYLSGNGVWFDATQRQRYGLFVSQDGGKTFAEYEMQYNGFAINSLALDENGALYAGTSNTRSGTFGPTFFRFTSVTPPVIEQFDIPGSYSFWCPRISTSSTRAWYAYHGPEIVADTSASSPHRGRLYAAWAQEEKVVPDTSFECPYYGYNFDVFVSYSDDKGQTWSPKARVNDDSGAGDQFFPSLRLDANGVLSVAFVDHRNNQDLSVFDIYYAKSSDGVKFSKNLRVNAEPVANNPAGGRTIGDYLDMVAAYPTRVYIAYPCGQSEYGPTGACMAQVDPRLAR